MRASTEVSCLTKGAVGGDSGWEAAFVSFRLAVETASAFEDGEMMNRRKPIASSPANTSVIGLVRRKVLGRAIANVDEYRQGTRENLEAPAHLCHQALQASASATSSRS